MEKMDKQKGFFLTVKENFNSLKQFLIQKSLNEWVQYLTTSFRKQWENVRLKIRDLRKANYDLAFYHLSKGNFSDCRFRLRILQNFFKDSPFPESNYYIALSYFLEGQYQKARNYIEKYINNNANYDFRQEIEYCLAVIDGKADRISSIPFSILSLLFDIVSEGYDEMYSNNLSDTPQYKLSHEVNKFANEKGKPYGNRILDLGCGTGILGSHLRSLKLASYIIGVDFSKKMLAMATAKKDNDIVVYNKTYNCSIDDYFTSVTAEKFNFICVSSLLLYYPNLSYFFSNCAKLVDNDGILALNFIPHEIPNNIAFNLNTQEFSYSMEYLKNTAKEFGWSAVSESEFQYVNDTKGINILFQRNH